MPPKKYSFQPIFFTTIGQPQQQLTKQEFKDMLEHWIEEQGLIEHHPIGLENRHPYVTIGRTNTSLNTMLDPIYADALHGRIRHGPQSFFGMVDGNWQGDFDKYFLNRLFNILKVVEQAPQPSS